MVKLPSGRKSPYYVLGVPSFASAHEIRAAYLKRVKALQSYRFDKSEQPVEWQVVTEVLEELNEAYTRLRPRDKIRDVQVQAKEAHFAPSFVEHAARERGLSHREKAEMAIQNYQRLTNELDDMQARQMFIKLVAARGFDESQVMPPVSAGDMAEPPSPYRQEGGEDTDHSNKVEPIAKGR